MKKSSFLMLCASLFLAGKSFAQNTMKPCGTDQMRQLYILQHPEILQYEADLEKQISEAVGNLHLTRAKTTDSRTDYTLIDSFWYDIPVVVHIVHDYNISVPGNTLGSTGDYIPDDFIFDALVNWNKIYANQTTAATDTADVIPTFKKWVGNPHIRVHLASRDPQGNPTKGITRVRSYLTYNGGDEAKYDDWDPTSYVNIWSVNTMSQSNGMAAAYATPPSSAAAFPSSDGIISLFDYVDYSNTINHEMGHIFNLIHPWGNNNNAAQAGVTCATGGSDGVDDTPPTLGHLPDGCHYTAFTSSYGTYYPQGNLYDTVCATNYFKVYTRPSTGVNDSLVNYPDTTNAQNIMDYTYCSKMFTIGQCRRMHAALNNPIAGRTHLWDTGNLIRTGVWQDALGHLVPRPDLAPIPDFCVANSSNNVSTLTTSRKYQQYFTKPGSTLVFKNRSWNDTLTKLVWTFTGGASVPTKTDNAPSYNTSSNVSNTFSTPGWASVTMEATGNHQAAAVTKTWNNAIFVADATGKPGATYFQEFDPSGDLAKWPIFNIFNNEFKWEPANVGYWDNYSMKYDGYDNRLDFTLGLYPSVGSPFGDYDDFFSTPMDLSGFGSGTCNLNFFTSAASRSSNSLDITDTFEVAYSTDAVNWVTVATYGKGNLINKGAVSTPYTPASSSDWVPRTVLLPSPAKVSYVLFRFRYRPGVDHFVNNPATGQLSGQTYSTGNNFYIDRIHFSPWATEVSSVVANGNNITIAPNPTSGNAFVIIKDADNTTARIVVSDITGKVVYTVTHQVSGNEASVEIPASAISVKGIYLVQATTGKQVSTQKLVVN